MSQTRATTPAVQRDTLRLVPAPESHLAILMTWFPTERSCREWGGPQFRFPFDATTFRADSRFETIASLSLVNGAEDDALVAFGQYYQRSGRCHLARLAVAPSHRGQRIGRELVGRLARRGCYELGVTECSLFVLTGNDPAVRLYEGIGFVRALYPPDAEPLENCEFMVWDPAP